MKTENILSTIDARSMYLITKHLMDLNYGENGFRATVYSNNANLPVSSTDLDKMFAEIIEDIPISETVDPPVAAKTAENIFTEIIK